MLHVFVIAFLLQAVISQAPPPPNVTCTSNTFLKNPQMSVCEFCTCKNNSVDHCYSAMDISGDIEVALMTLCPSLSTCTSHVYVFDNTANSCSCPTCGQSNSTSSPNNTTMGNNSTSGCSYSTKFNDMCSFCMCSTANGVTKESCVNSSSTLGSQEINKIQSYCHLSGSCDSSKWTWGTYNGISLDSCCPSCGNMSEPQHNDTHSPFSTQADCAYTIETIIFNDVSKCAVCDCNYNDSNANTNCRAVSSNMSSNGNSIDWIRKACSSLQMCETQYWVFSESCACPTCNKPSTTHVLNNSSSTSTTQSNKCANSDSIGCNVFNCESNDQAEASIKFEVWGTTRYVWDSRSQVWSTLKWAFNELSMTYASLNVSAEIKIEDWSLKCNFNDINVGNETKLNDTNNTNTNGRRRLLQDGGTSTSSCSFYVKIATYFSSSVSLETVLEALAQNSANISPDYARNCNETSKNYDTYGFNGVTVSQYTITEYDSSGNVVSSTTGGGNKSEGFINVYNMIIMFTVMIVSLIMFTH